MKFYVKRSKFCGNEDLKTRIAEPSNGIRAPALLNTSQDLNNWSLRLWKTMFRDVALSSKIKLLVKFDSYSEY
jgi:hypothetical protein